MRQRTIAAVLPGLLLLAAVAGVLAQSLAPIPKLESRVTDTTGTLTAEQQAALEQKLAAFEARKGSQLAVLIVPTTEPEAIEQYGIRVVDQWKLGRRKVDDGALLLIAKADRNMRIEVGRGLEGALTDATSSRIIHETITPLFRQGDFYGGINSGLDQMMQVVQGEPLPPPDSQWKSRNPRWIGHLPILFIGVLVISSVLRSIFGRGVGSILSGGAIGFIAWLLSGTLVFAIFAAGVAAVLALFSGMSGRGWSSLPRGGGWGGGLGGGGFGGGGLGGGGFSGGGGGFSGGGASGRW